MEQPGSQIFYNPLGCRYHKGGGLRIRLQPHARLGFPEQTVWKFPEVRETRRLLETGGFMDETNQTDQKGQINPITLRRWNKTAPGRLPYHFVGGIDEGG